MPTDREVLTEAYKGNIHAVELVLRLAELSHVWDDLVDKDKPGLTNDHVNRAFWLALVEIPRNPFYQANFVDLQPLIAQAIINWEAANRMERSRNHEHLVLAHVLRYSVADIATHIAFLIGGRGWAQAWAPELRTRSQKDTLENFLREHEVKDAA